MDRKTYLAQLLCSEKNSKFHNWQVEHRAAIWQQKVEYEKQHMSDTPYFPTTNYKLLMSLCMYVSRVVRYTTKDFLFFQLSHRRISFLCIKGGEGGDRGHQCQRNCIKAAKVQKALVFTGFKGRTNINIKHSVTHFQTETLLKGQVTILLRGINPDLGPTS